MLPERLAGEIAGIAGDRRSGAAALTRRAAEALSAVADRDLAIEAARALAAAQPAMAPIQKLAARLAEHPELAGEICRATLHRLDTAPVRIAEEAARVIPVASTVMTNSSSSTVAAVLERVRPERILVAESRPLCEGAGLARRLGASAFVIADAAVYRFMLQVDVVLVGADCVSPAGVVNKIGTAPMALAAREWGVPVYVACDTDKLLPHPLPEEEPRDPGELATGVAALNFYFETVPPGWFAGIITEEGIVDPARLAGAP